MAMFARASANVFYNKCHSTLTLYTTKIKLCDKLSSKILSAVRQRYNIRCNHTEALKNSENPGNYLLYDDLLKMKRLEASRSILVQIQSAASCIDLCHYCQNFGDIIGAYHYSIQKDKHFLLIEFKSENSIKNILASATHTNFDQIVPVESSMLWFRNAKASQSVNYNFNESIIQKHCSILPNIDIWRTLLKLDTVSNQINKLYSMTKQNNVGFRLKFYTAHQIERSFYSLFPSIEVVPFGSSVNGFGKQGCDLDLTLVLEKTKKEKLDSRLVFHTKTMIVQEREQFKQSMGCIADVMSIFMPGITNVRKILQARVPIIKFDNLLTGLECDLSMTNMTSHYMSELLYLYGEIDWRLRPITFSIKKWAQVTKITNPFPGPWITNFSLSLMVIFFLQQKKILPSLNFLHSNAEKNDFRLADVYVDCTFLRDISKIPKTTNVDSLETLLHEFFSYYENFDFETQAISLRDGKPVPKPEYSALYIFNPLETALNVSKNVRYEELQRIKTAFRNALWILESSDKKETSCWGIVSLFLDKNSKDYKYLCSTSKINIKSLFNEGKGSRNNNKDRKVLEKKNY